MTSGGAARPLRVLVVEDNVDSAEMISTLLKIFGHEPRVEQDAAAGLRALADFSPDVAVLDIGLPGIDGYELARTIRRTPGFEQLPLIALSGWGTPDDVQRGREAGFEHHLTKPACPEDLERLLVEVSRRHGKDDAAGT